MCDSDVQHQILLCLQQIEASLNSDQYETSDPFTVGGASGNYQISSPWNTECEWAIASALGVGTLASTATFVIGSRNPQLPTLASTYSFGNITTTGRDASNPLEGYVGALTSQAPLITYDAQFMPLPSPATIYLVTSTPATTAVFLTVMFRRKLTRYIPEKPRQHPHTHSIPSRSQLRRMPAQSTMVAGYEDQYPRPGGPAYHHEPVPVVNQDTAVAKRGVFPLGPTKGKMRSGR